MTTGAILLAAGFSRRFGSIKLRAVLPDGSTMLQRTSRLLLSVTSDIMVITRPALRDTGVFDGTGLTDSQIVLCEDADLGMGHSLACGIRALPANWDACVICLADMPFIEPATLKQLLGKASHSRITVPEYKSQRGHPVCFGRDFFAELAQSQGDTGGREVIKHHPDKVDVMTLNDPGILQDIDTPQDLTAC
ncbi:nucleotidyltransferase family protein [Pseudohongiella sp.]|uniref:MobA-like NTP transferase domain-containing protein n=1 Tax=marine sediment metagenome TaxID=412755 RepID=A0A0F9W0D9_9ZZZZ|nr:nucleotidyltransferase family protein [Pseudohongiella sp.]HDZ09981.1 nucleotidyltransferase family protein [Pseudohongiella sp.]HEA62801.1 nucleotidyltransferase family protein [Pseudohongiella sp.]